MSKLENLKVQLTNPNSNRHPKCKGYIIPDTGWGTDFDCGYNTKIDCNECKYGGGRKDPNAKCNWK